MGGRFLISLPAAPRVVPINPGGEAKGPLARCSGAPLGIRITDTLSLCLSFLFLIVCCFLPFFFFFFFCFLGSPLRRMEVPRLRVKSELQLQAYATATATQDLSHVCDLHHSSQHHQILNPLNEPRDRTHILTDTSRIHFRCATTGTPSFLLLFLKFILLKYW